MSVAPPVSDRSECRSTACISYASIGCMDCEDEPRIESNAPLEIIPYAAELDEDGAIAVTCYSVTASSPDEKEALRKFIDGLPRGLHEVVNKYPRLFSPPDAFSPPREVVHDIKLKPGVLPVRRPPYPLGESKLAAMKTQMQELFDKGWIAPFQFSLGRADLVRQEERRRMANVY